MFHIRSIAIEIHKQNDHAIRMHLATLPRAVPDQDTPDKPHAVSAEHKDDNQAAAADQAVR